MPLASPIIITTTITITWKSWKKPVLDKSGGGYYSYYRSGYNVRLLAILSVSFLANRQTKETQWALLLNLAYTLDWPPKANSSSVWSYFPYRKPAASSLSSYRNKLLTPETFTSLFLAQWRYSFASVWSHYPSAWNYINPSAPYPGPSC